MRSQQALLRRIESVERLARGKLLAKGTSSSGQRYYNLMYRKNTKLFSKHVATREVSMYAEATANYAALRKLFDAYVDEMSARTMKQIAKEARKCKDRK